MIDLHNHILPGLDDGAADLEESVEIARSFVSEGVIRAAATPHLDPENKKGATADVVHAGVADVRMALTRENVKLDVQAGNELYLTPDAPELLEQRSVATLGGGPYVLVEVPFNQRPLYMEETLFRLQLAGFRPILAHPERYSFVNRDLSSVEPLLDRDVILQLTAPALLGDYGPGVQRTAAQLLRAGAYALAASDRHHPGGERSLAALHERISKLTDMANADLLLCQNPAQVLDGGQVVPPQMFLSAERPSLFSRLFGGARPS